MSYTVLARKYRSKTFDELVGQEAIATTLKNAIATGRVHHGYLFCGTRGVGKTSMARILAKALNCTAVDAPTTEPCGQCESCQAVAEGEDVDVIEIDAASNTGVDNIRELRSNVIYRPARARFKIYIIDEVHMLSTGAFNALLKTLEEPPGHVKFIFATTEPHKVPPTIHSRCQRFDFRPIPADKISAQLVGLAKAEGAKIESEAARRLARLANGSMRDGLSLLDQLLSLGATTIGAGLIDDILPSPGDELLADLVDRFADGDAAGALAAADRVLGGGYGLEQFCESLVNHLRAAMILAICGPKSDLVDVSASVRGRLAGQAGRFDGPAYVYMIGLLEELRRNVRFSGAGRALTDAAMVRLACTRQFSSIERLLSGLGPGGDRSDTEGAAPAGSKKKEDREPDAVAAAVTTPQSTAEAPGPPGGVGETAVRGSHRPPGRTEPAGPSTNGRVSRQEAEAALGDALVRKALEVFDGTAINVERAEPMDEPSLADTEAVEA